MTVRHGHSATVVLLEASTFHRFFAVPALQFVLPSYFSGRGCVMPAVAEELGRLSGKKGEYISCLSKAKFPGTLGPLPDDLQRDVLAIVARIPKKQPDNPLEHLGEIETVFGAYHHDVPLIIADDAEAKKVLNIPKIKAKGITRMSTAQLICEMCARGVIPEADARPGFFEAAGLQLEEHHFRSALKNAKARLLK